MIWVILHASLSPATATVVQVAESGEKQVRLFKVASFKVDQLPVLATRFSGEMLMALTKGGKACALNVTARKRVREFKCADKLIKVGAFSGDGKWLACSDESQVVKVYELASGKEVATIRGHGGEIRQMAFSPHGELLAIACEGCCNMEGDTRLWWAKSGKLFRRLSGDAFSVAFLGGSKLIAVGGRNAVAVWDVSEGKMVRRLQVGLKVNNICFSDKRGLLIASAADGVRPFELSSWRVKPLIEVRRASSLSCSPDGSLLAVGTYDGVTVVDTIRWKAILRLTEHGGSFTSVAFSQDGALLAAANVGGMVVVWKVVRQKQR